MAAKMPCPTCKKQISMEAEACPKCGQPITEEDRVTAQKNTKRAKKGCLWFLGIFFALAIFGSIFGDDDTKKAETTATPAPVATAASTIKTFDYDFQTFLWRFNDFTAEANARELTGPFNKETGEVKDTMQIIYSEAAILLLTFDKKRERVAEITMISAGAKENTALDPVICMGGVIAAACPLLDADGRGQVLRDMGIITDSGAHLPEKASTIRGDVKFWAMTSPELGFWFGATPK